MRHLVPSYCVEVERLSKDMIDLCFCEKLVKLSMKINDFFLYHLYISFLNSSLNL